MRSSGRLLLFCLFAVLFLGRSAWADPVSDYNVAVEFYKQQRWQLAADSCEEFLKKYPQHERAPSARLYLAQAFLHLKKYAEARSNFERFLTQAPGHLDRPLAMYRIGECSSFLGDDQAAELQFNQFLKAYPEHDLAEWALLHLGEAQFRLKRYEAAAKTFEQSLKKYPEGRLLDDVQFDLAGVYDALNQKDKAEALLKIVAEKSTGSRATEALFQLGARSFDRQDFETAANLFARLATQYPQHRLASNAQLNAGYALYSLGRYADAINAFTNTAKDPQFTGLANFWKGLSQKGLKQYAEASQTLSGLLTSHPDAQFIDKATFHLADAEFRQGHFDKSIDLFQQVASKYPASEFADDALHAASEAALQAGQPKKALELHEQFMKSYEKSPLRPVEDLLAARVFIALAEKGATPEESNTQYSQAQTLLTPLIEQKENPRMQAVARFQLARLFERRNDNQKVLETLKPLLDGTSPLETPELQDARLLNANSHLRLDQSGPAAEGFRLYLDNAKTAPERVTGMTGLARALIQSQQWGDLKKVLDELNKIDREDAQFSRIAMAAGDAAFDKKNFAESEALFQLVISRGDAGAFYLPAISGLAHTEYENQQYQASAESFAKLAASTEKDPLLRSHAAYMHALSLQKAGEKEKALAAYEAAFETYSKRNEKQPLSEVDVQVGLNALRCAQGGARLARDAGNRQVAEKLYAFACDELKTQPKGTPPGLDQMLNEWANMVYAAEDYARSDELYARIIAETPESSLVPEAQLILGESARFGGDTKRAMDTFRQLAMNPKADDFIRQRALVHLLDLTAEAGQWKTVLTLSEQLQKDFSGGPHALYAAYREGEAQLKLKSYDNAVAILERAKASLPEDLAQAPAWWPEIWLMLSECHYWLKNYAKLDLVIAELRTKNPPEAVLYRIDALQGRGLENRAQFDDARTAYRRVVDSEAGRGTETAAESQFRIAETYLKENNLPVALREYYKVYAGYAVPRLSAAALFQAASCDVSMKHYQEAITTYQKLLTEFPNSEFTEQAKARVKELEAALSKG